jgi:hypothetical protein
VHGRIGTSVSPVGDDVRVMLSVNACRSRRRRSHTVGAVERQLEVGDDAPAALPARTDPPFSIVYVFTVSSERTAGWNTHVFADVSDVDGDTLTRFEQSA